MKHAIVVLTLLIAPRAIAVSCPTPGHVQAETCSNCFYDASIANGYLGGYGSYGVRTGIFHPITASLDRQCVITAGAELLRPVDGFLSVRSWDSSTDYFFSPFTSAIASDRGYDCTRAHSLPPPTITPTRIDGRRVGTDFSFEVEQGDDSLQVGLHVQVHGAAFEDSAVEVTARVKNNGFMSRRIGIRHAWNVGIDLPPSTTAYLGPVHPDPPSPLFNESEHELTTPFPDYFVVSSRRDPADAPYLNGLSVSGPWTLSPSPTLPERIVPSRDVRSSAVRGGLANTCFAWSVDDIEPPRPASEWGGVQALAYFWGATPETAIVLGPGESTSVTVWMWAFLQHPLTCDAGEPLTIECQGDVTEVTLDGTASSSEGGSVLLHRWRSQDSALEIVDPESPTPTILVHGLGRHEVAHDVGVGPYVRTCTATVEVVDATPPVLVVPSPITIRTSELPTATCAAAVTLMASASDACGVEAVTHTTEPAIGSGGADASRTYPLGTTTVRYVARDAAGNEAVGQTTVTIIDDRPPELNALTPSPSHLWPPNHRLVPVTIDAEAVDDCDVHPRIMLVGAASSEPDDNRGDGHTRGDIRDASVGWEDTSVLLRAERSGRGAGRYYELSYAAIDGSGNTSEPESARVVVAHDERAP